MYIYIQIQPNYILPQTLSFGEGLGVRLSPLSFGEGLWVRLLLLHPFRHLKPAFILLVELLLY